MTVSRFLAGTTERDALENGDVVADNRSRADDEPGGMIKEQALDRKSVV